MGDEADDLFNVAMLIDELKVFPWQPKHAPGRTPRLPAVSAWRSAAFKSAFFSMVQFGTESMVPCCGA
jgi:hypothetical protein